MSDITLRRLLKETNPTFDYFFIMNHAPLGKRIEWENEWNEMITSGRIVQSESGQGYKLQTRTNQE